MGESQTAPINFDNCLRYCPRAIGSRATKGMAYDALIDEASKDNCPGPVVSSYVTTGDSITGSDRSINCGLYPDDHDVTISPIDGAELLTKVTFTQEELRKV